MRFPRCPVRTLITTVAAIAVTTGVCLEVWGAADRRAASRSARSASASSPSWGELVETGGDATKDPATEAREHPTSAAYARLAQVEAARGHAKEAASAALTASRLAPDNAAMAATAEGYVDTAFRAHIRDGVRPFAFFGALLLVFSFVRAARRHRADQYRDAVLANARGRIVLAVEGDGEARADTATLRPPGAKALVIDVHGDSAIASLKKPPPLVVALTNSAAGRTVRLAPRKDAAGGAARFRVTGDSLREVVAHSGSWRILVRAGGALLASGRVVVEPSTRANGRAA